MSTFSEKLDLYKGNAIKVAKERKYILFLGGALVAYCGYLYLSAPTVHHNEVKSNISRADAVKSNITAPISENYRNKLKQHTNEQADQAKKDGKSFIPPVVGIGQVHHESDGHINMQGDFSDEAEARQASAPSIQIDSAPAKDTPALALPQQQVPKPAVTVQPKRHIVHRNYIAQSRYEMLKDQMTAAAAKDEEHNQVVEGSIVEAIATNSSSGMNAGSAASLASIADTASDGASFQAPVDGTAWRGHMIRKTDSREPTRVYGQLDSGPYKGSMVIGSFSQNGVAHKLSIRFNEIVYRYEGDDGYKSGAASISAVAINPSTGTTGFADYVNQHMLQKILIPLATSFATGIGQAISQSGSSSMMSASGGSVISQGTKSLQQQLLQAMGQTGSQMGSVLQSMFGNVPDTIQVYAGTPFLMVFDGANSSGAGASVVRASGNAATGTGAAMQTGGAGR